MPQRHVDAPGIVLIFERAEAGDGIDHQQRRMLDPVHDLADVKRVRDAAGRGLVVHDHDRLDLVLAVVREPRLDLLEVGAMAPVTGQEIDVQLEFVGDAAP